mgnify:CR=1 FL=1
MIFEKYHPIMTKHYELDWLTTFKVKEIFALRHDASVAKLTNRDVDATIMDTAAHVNRVMSKIMHNDALVWGIGDKRTGEFLGTFGFDSFVADRTTAAITFELLPSAQRQGVMSEVLSHMLSFAFDELDLQKVIATVQSANVQTVMLLKGQGFTLDRETTGELQFKLRQDER